MNVQVVQPAVQWEEIQRTAQQRNIQRQQVAQRDAQKIQSAYKQEFRDETRNEERQSQQRVVFTNKATLAHSYLPKGTIFDKAA